jgi:hypothetical protein
MNVTFRVTREVITDLWPAYAAGEASGDTRTLIEEFLDQDHEFARLLREDKGGIEGLLELGDCALSPDREAQALSRTKQVLHGQDWLQFLAILFTCFAFGRIIADTSWDVSPRNFLITSAIAAGFWVAFFVRTAWVRRQVYHDRIRRSR